MVEVQTMTDTGNEDMLRDAFKMYMKTWRSNMTEEAKKRTLEKQRERYHKNKEAHKVYHNKYVENIGGREVYNKYYRDAYQAKQAIKKQGATVAAAAVSTT